MQFMTVLDRFFLHSISLGHRKPSNALRFSVAPQLSNGKACLRRPREGAAWKRFGFGAINLPKYFRREWLGRAYETVLAGGGISFSVLGFGCPRPQVFQ